MRYAIALMIVVLLGTAWGMVPVAVDPVWRPRNHVDDVGLFVALQEALDKMDAIEAKLSAKPKPPALTWEIRATRVPDSTPPYLMSKYEACRDSVDRYPGWHYAEERWDWYRGTEWAPITEFKNEWWLYAHQTINGKRRTFRVCKVEEVGEQDMK